MEVTAQRPTTPQTTTTELAPVYNVASDQNPALVYLASLSSGSRRTMRQALDVMADILSAGRCDNITLPWWRLRFQHTQALKSILSERYSAATANKMLSALRQTLKMAWGLGYMDADEYHKAVNFKSVIEEKPEAAAGRALSFGEWMALIQACIDDGSPAGARDAAIIALLKVAGLRRSEVASLQLADFNFVTNTLTVQGKRNKTRTIPVEDMGAQDALADWLYFRGHHEGPLFSRIKKGGDVTNKALTDQGVYFVLSKRREQAKVAEFTPHDMRRSFAGDLLDAGADISTVQKLMGHSSADTTVGYDRRGERAKREAVKKLHVPYQRRYLDISA